ncbi:MAK10-like protein [Tanacetum coccineum]
MTNKVDTLLKAINDRMTGALPSDTVKNPKLNVNPTFSVSSARSYPMEDPQSLSLETPKSKEPKSALEDELKDLHIKLSVLEVLAHAPMYNAILDKYVKSLELGKNGSAFIQGKMPKKMKDLGLFTLPWLADGTRSYLVGIVKNVEVNVGKLKLLEDFYIIDMEKDPTCPLLIGRGFLATASAVIDYRKAKIAVGEGVTRSIFGVKEIGLGHVNTPYWTTLSKRKSYESQPSTNYIGGRPPYYLEKDFMKDHLLGELEIARDSELNPFKDVLVFRKMVEFLGTIPINFKGNMWESEDLIEKKIDWKRPPKEGDGAWHIRIEINDPDGEKIDTTFQSIPTTRKLCEKERLSDIIYLEHFHDS